jgi:hypothetical protein
MRRVIGGLCSLAVGLQILVGVPLVVCFVFFSIAGNGPIGPVAVEVHANSAPTTIPPPAIALTPPPNAIPQPLAAPHDNPILVSRAEHGSPLAGTVLGASLAPEAEQQLFVAAFEKVAAEQADAPPPCVSPQPEPAPQEPRSTNAENLHERADQFAVRQLYAMAEMDEQDGNYERADQWRSLAREIRRKKRGNVDPQQAECPFSLNSAN